MQEASNILKAARQRGAVLVETVLVLPILLLLILGAAEFGNAFWQYSALTKTVRDGARFAANEGLFGSTGVVVLTTQLRADVANIVVYGNTAGTGSPRLAGFSIGDVVVEAPGDGDIVVRASYSYDAIFGVINSFYGGTFSAPLTMNAAVRMRAL